MKDVRRETSFFGSLNGFSEGRFGVNILLL